MFVVGITSFKHSFVRRFIFLWSKQLLCGVPFYQKHVSWVTICWRCSYISYRMYSWLNDKGVQIQMIPKNVAPFCQWRLLISVGSAARADLLNMFSFSKPLSEPIQVHADPSPQAKRNEAPTTHGTNGLNDNYQCVQKPYCLHKLYSVILFANGDFIV